MDLLEENIAHHIFYPTGVTVISEINMGYYSQTSTKAVSSEGHLNSKTIRECTNQKSI